MSNNWKNRAKRGIFENKMCIVPIFDYFPTTDIELQSCRVEIQNYRIKPELPVKIMRALEHAFYCAPRGELPFSLIKINYITRI